MIWSVYLIRLPNNRLYCGISKNVSRRFDQHQRGKGARITRCSLDKRHSMRLVYSCKVSDSQKIAMWVERIIKKFSKAKKEYIVANNIPVDELLKIQNKSKQVFLVDY